MPNQITEVVIAMAPTNTNTGGSPKYTSDKMPKGMSKPVKASHEIVLALFNWVLNLRSR